MIKQLLRRKPLGQVIKDSDYEEGHISEHGLKRSLTVLDLTSFGVAAVIGAGIFSTIGSAAYHGGPAVSLLFVFTAIACGFSALCYAQFASTIPASGSAYTYAYASLGELVAWVIGWTLIMEYAIGNIAVAISWSDYFTALLYQYGVPFPAHFSMDFMTAKKGYDIVQPLLASGLSVEDLASRDIHQSTIIAYDAYRTAPRLLGLPLVGDLPAVFVNIFVTWIVYIGIKESKRVANAMVLLKVIIVLLVIGLGAFYIEPKNLTPFAPNGLGGVLKGISGVFFAYIGFDAISTTAEECKNPKRDLPRAMFLALFICTALYVMISLVLTGVVSYKNLNVGDPLAYVFGPEGANIPWIATSVSGSAIIALFSVLLVFQLGQPRIWMVMGRDGLLPKKFAELHPKYKTPWFSTIMTGVLVGLPCLFMNLTEVTDLSSIGTLFAFFLVSMGVLFMDRERAKFKVPYINGRWFFPPCFALLFYYICSSRPELLDMSAMNGDTVIFGIYFFLMAALTALAIFKQWSLIPLLGATTCSYLMTELGVVNWVRFGLWLVVGMVIYFFYGYHNSRLNRHHEK